MIYIKIRTEGELMGGIYIYTYDSPRQIPIRIIVEYLYVSIQHCDKLCS